MALIIDTATNSLKEITLAADPLFGRFHRELEKFAALLAGYGRNVPIASDAALEAWARKTTPEKQAIYDAFSGYRRICSEMQLAGVSLRDNRALSRYTLKRFGLEAHEDLDRLITNESVVEIYNTQNVQLFRSVNFFDYCNYSLMDLSAREWFVLYERLSSVTEEIMRTVGASLATGSLRRFSIPTHVMKERFSDPRGVFQIELQQCCPLFNSAGIVAGFLVTQGVSELDVLASDEEARIEFLR